MVYNKNVSSLDEDSAFKANLDDTHLYFGLHDGMVLASTIWIPFG